MLTDFKNITKPSGCSSSKTILKNFVTGFCEWHICSLLLSEVEILRFTRKSTNRIILRESGNKIPPSEMRSNNNYSSLGGQQ